MWKRAKEVGEKALSMGVLKPIEVENIIHEEMGLRFTIKYASSLSLKPSLDEQKKKEEKKNQEKSMEKKRFNPFHPFEKELFIGSINVVDDSNENEKIEYHTNDISSSSHVLVLNKFKVMDEHSLLITREEKSQLFLEPRDFKAISYIMYTLTNIDEQPLFFYNCGPLAGASQPHRHVQFIPSQHTAIDFLLNEELSENNDFTCFKSKKLNFNHRIIKLSEVQETNGTDLHKYYIQALKELSLDDDNILDEIPTFTSFSQSIEKNYNLLLNRRFLFIIPRIKEEYMGISLNALGYSGSVLVKRKEDLEKIREIGFETLWKQTT